MKRSGRKSASQTPAPKADRIKGSSKNPKGSAASKKSAASINLSESITKTLSDKRTKFIKEHPNKSVSLATLKAVMRRGMGAYSTSYRPTITGGRPNSRQAWGFARVNKFLLKKGGTKVKAAYVQDDDLLENGGKINDKYDLLNKLFSQINDSLEKNGLNIDNNYLIVDESGNKFEPIFSSKNDGKEIIATYYEDGFEVLGEIEIEIEDDKVEVDIEFPKFNVKDEFYGFETYTDDSLIATNEKFKEGGQTNYLSGIESFNKMMKKNWIPQFKIEYNNDVSEINEMVARHYLYSIAEKYYGGVNEIEFANQSKNPKNHFQMNMYLGEKILSTNPFIYVDDKHNVILKKTKVEVLNDNYDTIIPNIKLGDGGELGKEITCVNCGWHWNTNQSDEFDKYVCHRCGFDNRTFYDSDPIGKYHLGGDMSKHLASNGKPSNLNHEQWHLVRTPQFKEWFGDWENDPENASKVVDENGEPLVVYHGTYAKEQFNFFDFDKADLGFHFGTDEQAKDRSETKIGVKGYKSIVTPYFLNIREQFNILDVREFEYPPKYLTELITNNVITEKESKENNFDRAIYRQDNKKIRDFLKAKYGDNVGFEYENKIEGEGKSFIVLHPNQIKLADGTNTMFDSENPDIRYEIGGLIAPNGKPSNLKPQQYKLVRTPKFKAWFGDWENDPETASKVVDENGEPLVVYHGSNDSFNVFDKGKNRLSTYGKGLYFTNLKNEYSKKGKYLYQVFLNLKNPLIIDIKNQNFEGEVYDLLKFERDFKLGAIIKNPSLRPDDQKVYDLGERTYYVADNSNQIKLADGSNTTFDAENPDIRYEDGGLIAPNGKESNLTPEQYKLVRTPEFKEWFGDWENDPENASKVVDENGEPMIVYHGSANKFNVFDRKRVGENYRESERGGFFFTQKLNTAKNYARLHTNLENDGFVYYCFLNIKNPLVRNTNSEYYSPADRYDVSRDEYIRECFNGNFDGIIINGTKKDNLYVVNSSNKIKLADGSNTTFDAENPDIRYNDGGLLHALDVSMRNLKKNGIVLKDNDGEIALIAYNTGNQEIKPSLYNKSLIYKSVQPIKNANEIIENFDSGNYERFDADKIDLLKKKHLIIINQNEIIYDNQNSSSVLKEGRIMKNQIALPDSYANYDTLKPILEKQGYSIQKMEKMEKKYNKGGSLSEKMTFLKTQREARKLEGYYNDGGKIGITNCQVLDKNGERKIDLESIEKMTDCLNEQPQTKFMHFDFDKNDYELDRKKLHRKIIYDFKKDLICVERDEPIAILMGGSPASGKSTFLKKYAPYLLKDEIFRIDADEIRSKLPEYKGYNATQTHLETKDIVNTLLSDRNIGIPCRFDLIYDGTMNNTKSYLPLINILKKDGYKVFIVYIDKVPKDVIVKRALERYKKSGRFVPLEVIDDFFEKGTAALEQLKNSVDGYMIIDGGDTNYKIIERGGKKLPQDRNYSKIGEPIKITTQDVVREFKKGGEIDPDDSSIKDAITHKSGSAGGLLVGKRHSEGGIKAINKSSNQMLEMEGGEVVITRNAVSDDTKREFEGEMLTNREILSRINQSGGGVSFADGGDVPSSCSCSGKKYNYGGHLKTDYEIVESINKPRTDDILTNYYAEGGKITIDNPIGKGEISIPTFNYFIKKAYVLQQNGIKYIPKYDELYQSVIYYRNGDKRSKKMSSFDAYKFFINQQFAIPFEKLSDSVKKLLIGK